MSLIIAAAIILATVGTFAMSRNVAAEIVPAPDFTAVDHLGRTFSLNESLGKVTMIHVTQLESPICIECEAHMVDQMRELAELQNDPDISVITLNVRKNPYSPDGWTLARDWWGINVTWHWVEEMDPYAIAGQYQEYWDVNGNFANPSLIMIDSEQNVVGVYHIYTMNSGEADGIQTADSLREDAAEIMAGEWTVFRGQTGTTTYLGVFLLGILSTFSPCSLFMLFAIISFIVSSGNRARRQTAGTGVVFEVLSPERKQPGHGNAGGSDWRSGLWVGMTFSLGMVLIFALFGALASYIGVFIESSTAFSLIVGITLAILGINIVWPLGDAFRRLFSRGGGQACGAEEDNTKRLMRRLEGVNQGVVGVILGILFTVGWTPCALAMVLPVLVMIISGKVTLIAGIGLMCAFALGRAVVVTTFCAAIGGMKSRIYGKFLTAGKWIQPIFGAAMIALGVIYALRYWGFNLW